MSNVIEFSIKAIDNFSAVMDKMHTQTTNMEKALVGAGIAGALYASVKMVQQSLDTAEAMGSAAEKANMATEEFSALSWAAKMSNVEQGSLTTGVKMLGKALAEGDASPAGKSLSALGIAARDAEGNLRPTIEVLMNVSDAFMNAKDDANKTKVAMELFGRSGVEMVPVLNQGSVAIKQMMADADALGMTISGDFAKSADQVNDNLATMAAVVQGSVNKAMAELSPTIELATGQLVAWATEGDNVARAGQVMATGMKLVMSAGTILFAVFESVGKLIGGVAAALVAIATGNFSDAMNIMKNTTVDLGTTIGETAAKVEMQWDGSAQSAAASAAKQASAARNAQAALTANAKQQADDAKEVQKAEDARQKSINGTIAELMKAGNTYGMTADQIKIYEMAMQGATTAQLEQALNLATLNAENEAHTASLEKAKGIIEASKTPLEEHNQKLQDIYASRSLLTDGQFEQAHAAEMAAWDEKRAAVEWYGVSIRSATQLVGSAMAQSIVDGTNMGKALEQVGKMVLKTIIGTYIQMGIQRMILSTIDKTATATEASSKMGAAMGQVYLNSFASMAAIPVVGWAAAPGVAAANTAIAMAGVGGAIGAGAGIGAMAGAAHGGLDNVPNEATYLLQAGERVLSPKQNKDLTAFLDESITNNSTMTRSEMSSNSSQEIGGGSQDNSIIIQSLTIHVLENATNVDAFTRMDKIQLRNALGQPIVDALNEMFRVGVRPDFATAGR